MSLDLVYSYFTGLIKGEEIIIDIQVSRNRENIINFPSNVKNKTKTVIIVSSLVTVLYFSNIQLSDAMGLSIPPEQRIL